MQDTIAAVGKNKDRIQGRLTITALNIEDNSDVAAQYGIAGIPTLLLVKNGTVQNSISGIVAESELCNRINQLMNADGVLFTSPVYVHSVSALLKNLFDRFAYFCHQPHRVGKTALLLVTTELTGTKETLKYMKFPVSAWGFHIAQGIGVVFPSYVHNPAYKRNIHKRIEAASLKLHHALSGKKTDRTFKRYVLFNLLKWKVTLHKDRLPYDYEYWKNKGWLKNHFFTTDGISMVKSFFARIVAAIMVKYLLRNAGMSK